ncbi:unnamed protein product [Thlaspi arvense]|uniref:Adenosylmethionine-8-amino-7-oxononanoate aminotransferase n=1 Tax=Thlaspi arvense TaxID=13288 RepID=A0AAU9RHP8_THLAR|nr:unnamed protein product [Thlaspi arvense]
MNVLALRGSYHGDTLGAMEAQAPSSYTSFLQQPWYECLCQTRYSARYGAIASAIASCATLWL